MALTPVTWVRRDPIESEKLQDMVDNTTTTYNLADKAPRGILARAKIKVNKSAANNSWWDIGDLTTSASFEANRVIKVSLSWQGLSSWGTPGIWAVQIQSNASPYTLAESYQNLTTDMLLQCGGTLFTTGVTNTAGSLTWKASLKKIGGDGNGTIFWLASTTGPSELIVEDIGAASNIQ